MRSPVRTGGLAALLGLALVTAAARADLIYLKDGFVLQGVVKRESTQEYDPVGRIMIDIPKGFFFVDDGPRRVYFSQHLVRIVEALEAPNEERVAHNKPFSIINPRKVPDLDD